MHSSDFEIINLHIICVSNSRDRSAITTNLLSHHQMAVLFHYGNAAVSYGAREGTSSVHEVLS